MSYIPTFGRRSPQVSEQPSGEREELIKHLWTFLRGIRTNGLIIDSGLSGDLLMIGQDGHTVIATISLSGDYTFSSEVIMNGTDLTVEVDALSLLSRDDTRNLIGLDTLAGSPVFVGQDPPAVATARLGKVDLTAQVANIATTALSNTPPAGFYEVEVYLLCTTADAIAGTLTVTVGWTDNVGATTSTPITAFALTVTGRTTGRQMARVASGNITYAVAVTGIYGTAAYAVYVRVVAKG